MSHRISGGFDSEIGYSDSGIRGAEIRSIGMTDERGETDDAEECIEITRGTLELVQERSRVVIVMDLDATLSTRVRNLHRDIVRNETLIDAWGDAQSGSKRWRFKNIEEIEF